MLDIVITSFITLVYHIIPGFQCNNSTFPLLSPEIFLLIEKLSRNKMFRIISF